MRQCWDGFVLWPEVIEGRVLEVGILGGFKREEGRAGDVEQWAAVVASSSKCGRPPTNRAV